MLDNCLKWCFVSSVLRIFATLSAWTNISISCVTTRWGVHEKGFSNSVMPRRPATRLASCSWLPRKRRESRTWSGSGGCRTWWTITKYCKSSTVEGKSSIIYLQKRGIRAIPITSSARLRCLDFKLSHGVKLIKMIPPCSEVFYWPGSCRLIIFNFSRKSRSEQRVGIFSKTNNHNLLFFTYKNLAWSRILWISGLWCPPGWCRPRGLSHCSRNRTRPAPPRSTRPCGGRSRQEEPRPPPDRRPSRSHPRIPRYGKYKYRSVQELRSSSKFLRYFDLISFQAINFYCWEGLVYFG